MESQLIHEQFLKICYLYHLKVKMLTVIALSLRHYKMVLGLLLSKGTPIDENVSGPIIWVEDTLTALQQLAQAYLRHVNPKVIAVTGSNGKTTTKDMIESVLHTEFKVKKRKVITIMKLVYL